MDIIVPNSTETEVIVNSSVSPQLPSKEDQLPSRKNHFITWFYDNIEQIVPIVDRAKKLCYKGTYQTEICPETKLKHLHFMLWGKDKFRDTALKIPKRNGKQTYRAFVLKDEKNVSDYANKDDPSYDGVMRGSWGFPKPIKIIEILRPWQQQVKDLCMTEPDDRKIYWYWDEEGDIGKSAFIKYMIVRYKALLCQGGKHSDIINLVFNCDMDDTNIVFFDIPRANKGNISYSSLECIKNGMVCNTKYETGVKVFNSPHLIVFANFPPSDTDMLSKDRWVITELKL